MKKIIFLLLLNLPVLQLFGQAYQPDKQSRSARMAYEKAQQLMSYNDVEGAETVLKNATTKDPGFLDGYALLATIYFRDKKYAEAVDAFAKAFKIDSTFATPLLLQYAKSEAGTGDFAEALRLDSLYLSLPNLNPGQQKEARNWKTHFEMGLETAAKKIPFSPKNLGDSINSPFAEYFPSLPIDQQSMVFTRKLNDRNEDFFISHLQEDGKWGLAENMGPPINTSYNEGAQNISQDGKYLLYTGCNFPNSYGSCDIYYSIHTANGWSKPANVGAPVNSSSWDSQPSLSPDNKDLYFVSTRPGGYGGSDIYVSHLQADGGWSEPQNLGPKINTAGDESAPFIHADNQTLYFASNGLPGIGSMDLFYVRKNLNGSWGTPVNLGYPINTIDHEGSLFIAADGKTAYFASDRSDSRGELDIYQFELYKAARPLKTLYVKGFVYDSVSGQRLSAIIDLIELESGKTITQFPTNSNGDYLVTLPVGKDYAFNVSKKGYLFYSDNFSLKDSSGNQPFLLNIPLQPVQLNANVALKNIFFEFNKYALKPESKIELDKLTQFLQENPSIKIQVNGYTDNVGAAEQNMVLSQQRAQAVIDYLQKQGIDKNRLTAKGYGETDPVADNSTDAGRAQNRRTTFTIVGM